MSDRLHEAWAAVPVRRERHVELEIDVIGQDDAASRDRRIP
jgi:hypothetical protein